MLSPRVHVFWLIALAACGGDPVTNENPPPPEARDLTVAVYEPTEILEVAITMSPADWDALAAQTRDVEEILGTDCLEGTRTRPFTYFPADITINGLTIPNVGVRKKGFLGSLSDEKPSIKVKFNEYTKGQRYASLKKLTLNNAIQDPSYVKQCIGYRVFAEAGVPAPRCNYAHVVVNGTDLGVYTNIESIGRDFLERNFPTDDGNMYEGALSDFRTDWKSTFERKTNKSDLDRTDIDELVTALDEANPNLQADVSQLIDIDAFVSFWAAEMLIAHGDGYINNRNNFYIYRDTGTGRFGFIPWGIDQVLGGEEGQNATVDNPRAVLGYRLYNIPEIRGRYLGRLQELLDTVWDETALLAEIDRMESLITPLFIPARDAEAPAAIEAVREFVRTRAAQITGGVNDAQASLTAGLTGPPCLVPVGNVDATFATNWGTLAAPDPFNMGFTGDVTGTVNMESWVTQLGTTVAGTDAMQGTVIQIAAVLSDDSFAVIGLNMDPATITPGTYALDFGGGAFGAVFRGNDGPNGDGEFRIVGVLTNGTVTFAEASPVDGQPLSGTLTAEVAESGLF